jgi:hypothetical protein
LRCYNKVVLLKFSKRPPMFDHKLNDMFLRYAPRAAWLHLAIATWAFGHHNIPSYVVDPADYMSTSEPAPAPSEEEFDNGDPVQFDVMSRLVRGRGLHSSTFQLNLSRF